MTTTLQDAIKQASTVFNFESDLAVPEPSPDWKRRLEALEEAHLSKQRTALLFDMRCWQAEKMGFQRFESTELVKMLIGEEHTDETEGEFRQTHEWLYFHHNDTVETKSKWGGKPTIFYRMERKGFWYLPPFAKRESWRAQFGKLDYLKREIPYGVVLRIQEVKKLKLFNAFNVLAPMEAWQRKTDIDPIVVASIWEMPIEEKSTKPTSAGQVAHFFLAQWE